jgi:hypothetical protein
MSASAPSSIGPAAPVIVKCSPRTKTPITMPTIGSTTVIGGSDAGSGAAL